MESTFINGFTPCIIEGDYYDHKEFISYSALKKIKQSPAHYKYGEEVTETEAMLFGSAYHCFILEPERFEKEYYVFDDHDICEKLTSDGFQKPRATKEYKQWEESQQRFMEDKSVVTAAQFAVIKEMKEVLFRHTYAKALLTNGTAEMGISGTLNTTSGDIKVKLKPDFIKSEKHFIVDLKTCADASLDSFARQAADMDYHIQAALYSDIMEMMTNDGCGWSFYFIAQEKKKPYAFNIFEASPQFIGQGRYEYEQLLKLYKMCLDNGKWPGYQVFCEFRSGNIELNLPTWAVKKIEFYDHKF